MPLVTEWKEFDVEASEPTNILIQGTVVSQASPLNYGQVDRDTYSDAHVVIWHATNMGSYSQLNDLRFWLETYSSFINTDFYFRQQLNWTQSLAGSDVQNGVPGDCPLSEPTGFNVNGRSSGAGQINGTGTDDYTEYIYLSIHPNLTENLGAGTLEYQLTFEAS